MSVDPKVYELAIHFLKDYEEVMIEKSLCPTDLLKGLSEHIQEAVEDYLQNVVD